MPIKKTRAKAQTSIEPSGSPALLRFHRTWQELEKLEAKIAKKTADMGTLYTRFQTDILPLEIEHCRLVYQQVERLNGFMGRKSLSDWQRELLGDWIDEDCRYLESNPFRGELDLTALTLDFQAQVAKHLSPETVAEQCDYLAQEFKEKLGIDVPDELLQQLVISPDKIEEFVQSWFEQQSDQAPTAAGREDATGNADELYEDDADDAFDDDGFESPYHQPMSPHEQAKLDELFGKSSLKQLYRKLALALHPDREPDETLREQKTRLMGELSRAWEHKDMFTLLQLAHAHLPSSESLLSEENLAVINPLLKLRLRQQTMEFYTRMEGVQGMVSQRFKGRSKKATEQAFVEHLTSLEQDIAAITARLATMTSLVALKAELALRLEAQEQRWEDGHLDISALFAMHGDW